ncbi:general amino acid permease [Fusarium agapanthi]|uniref:General amino acid permease n=1 Tax=Fusarium agapanthi TaxID=1803897 RepID=A0A9P5B6U4_9HYPO|nr:general amino acid permease [Fusarium agapanthi]
MVSISQQDDSKKFALDTSVPTNTCDTSSIQRASIYITNGQTERGLSPRHVQLMAIAGSIGTALFVGIGGALSKAGPLSLSLGYLFWSMFFILPCTLSIAEMYAYLPIRGSIFELASRFLIPLLASPWAGLLYVETFPLKSVVRCPSDLAILRNTSINAGVWVAMALVVSFLLNVIAIKWYAESEFIMASTKVILIIGLILLTLITMCGGNPRGDAYGFRYWGGGNAMHAYYTDGAAGRFLGFCRDEQLLNAMGNGDSGAAASPWVIGIQNLGPAGARTCTLRLAPCMGLLAMDSLPSCQFNLLPLIPLLQFSTGVVIAVPITVQAHGAYFAFVLCCIFILFIGWDTFSPFDVEAWISYYFATAFGPLMFVIGKHVKKTTWVKPSQAHLTTGKAEVDEECQVWEDPSAIENEKLLLQQMNWLRRFWERLW